MNAAAGTGQERRPSLPRAGAVAALAAVLLLAAVVRCWRLDWGLDQRLSFPDEGALWNSYLFAFRSPRWEALFGHPLGYPPLYGYLIGLAVAGASVLGLVGPGQDLLAALLVARGVSAVAGLATVLLVWLLGTRGYGACAGLVAAAFVAAIPLEAMQTHYASVDVLLGALTALVLLAGNAFTQDRRPLLAFASGACVALAFATKYNALVLAAVPGWVVLEVAFAERSPRRVLVLGAACALGFGLTLVLVCPPWIFETRRIFGRVSWISDLATSPSWLPPNNHVTASVGWYGRPYLYQLVALLPFALGWPMYLAALAGVAVALGRRTTTDRVLLVSLAVLFFFVGRTRASYARYLIPLFPALALLAARALSELRVRAVARIVLCSLVVCYGFALGFSQVARFSYDQQIAVAQFLREALPAGAGAPPRIVVPWEMAGYYRLRQPLHRVGLEMATAAPGKWLAGRPEAFVLPEWYATSIRRDGGRDALRSDLERLESGALGYREAARWRSTYLQESLYTWLDPSFASALSMGEIGFRVYLRDDLVTAPPAPAEDRR